MPTQTQDDFKPQGIDLVHINPSIMEGTNLYTSILGPDVAFPLLRYAPTFLVNPVISGNIRIPNTLTCYPGVFDSSPYPQIFYQWQSGGVDIIGEESNTYLTVEADDDQEITCLVTIVNDLGTDSASSNIIIPQNITEIEVKDLSLFTVTGIEANQAHTILTWQQAIVLGMWVDVRFDLEYCVTHIVTGWGQGDRLDLDNMNPYILTGLEAEQRLDLYSFDCYAIHFSDFYADLALLNPGAELGDMTNWTQVPTSSASVIASSTSPRVGGGTYSFQHTSSGISRVYQDVVTTVPQDAIIDAGNMEVSINYWHTKNHFFSHKVKVGIECYDVTDTLIIDIPQFTQTEPTQNIWLEDRSGVVTVPPLTRKFRVYLEFDAVSSSNACRVDEIEVTLWEVV